MRFFSAHRPGRVSRGGPRSAPVHGIAALDGGRARRARRDPDSALRAVSAIRRLAIILATSASLLVFFSATPAVGAAAASVPDHTIGQKILDKAETQAGCWYSYGHAGPCNSGYDCSGLVYWAAHRLGVNLPRTTYQIMASRLVYRIPLSSAVRGDLLFYGSGHVEIDTVWRHTSFGALHTGTRVGWHNWNAYWHPTMAFRIR